MRCALFLLVFSILYGCMPNQCLSVASDSEVNVYHIARLERGMNQAEVLRIMRHPYKDELFRFDEDTYDVWFYVTGRVVLGQSRMMPANLTPLAFKNGILIGWGNNYYNLLKARRLEEEEQAKMAPEPTPIEIKQKELENQELEKVLQPATPSTPGQKKSRLPTSAPQKNVPQTPGTQPNQPSRKPSVNLPKNQPKPSSPGQTSPGQKPEVPAQSKPDWSPVAPPENPKQQPQGEPQKGGPNLQNGKQQQPTQSNQTKPDWSPLEKEQQPPTQNPPATQTGPDHVTMSRNSKSSEATGEKSSQSNQPEEKKIPLNEEDEKMLQDERDQDFNQT